MCVYVCVSSALTIRLLNAFIIPTTLNQNTGKTFQTIFERINVPYLPKSIRRRDLK